MAVIILHPSEELKLSGFQKDLISELFDDKRILVAAKPLWIHLPDTIQHKSIKSIIFDDLETSAESIFIPVEIETTEGSYTSRLTLVILHSGRQFSGFDRQSLQQKKQPVRQLKVFRLGIEKELSSNSKCITGSKWVKLQ